MLFFTDPDGLQLELIATADANPDRAWNRGAVPMDFAIRGFHHVTLSENGYERTASLLSNTLGFKRIQEHGARFRYAAASGAPGTMVDLICAPEGRPGRVAVGTVHHVAWRTPTNEQQGKWREIIRAAAVLFRVMVPFTPDIIRDFRNLPVFIGAGERDPIVPRSQPEQLGKTFKSGGANVTLFWHSGGHELGEDDVEAAKTWLSEVKFRKRAEA
jgi:catechol 2,3-dioxygenase-like lactoylglutathione lyase family enzyme